MARYKIGSLSGMDKAVLAFIAAFLFAMMVYGLPGDNAKAPEQAAPVQAAKAPDGSAPGRSSIERCVSSMVGIGMQYYGLGIIEANRQAWETCKADATRRPGVYR